MCAVVVCFILVTGFSSKNKVEANAPRHHISHSGIRSVDRIKPSSFGDSIFSKYGNNGSMDLNRFTSLLHKLEIGTNDDKYDAITGEVGNKCLTASSLLDIYSINKTALKEDDFKQICPAIVQQIEAKTCHRKVTKNKINNKQSKARAWGFGFLSVTLISCASLLGAFVVPFMSQDFYQTLLLFMVSLAVGVLSGSGIFHLIPATFSMGYDGKIDYLYKCCMIVGGIYLFFILEYIMKMYIRFKDPEIGQDHSHGHGHSHGLQKRNKDKSEVPGEGIAEIQLEMYNYRQDHHRAHSNSFCVNNDLNKKPDRSLVKKICANTGETLSEPSEDSVFDMDDAESPVEQKRKKEKNIIAPVCWMIVLGDALHNFIDGLAIGAGYSSSILEGASTALAIFCEELPHELGDFAVLLNGGMTYKQAMFFNFISACTCFLGLVMGLLLGYATPAVKWIYALAAGMFIYISLVNMLQEATEMSVKEGEGSIKKNLKTFALQNVGMIIGFVVMFILAIYGPEIRI